MERILMQNLDVVRLEITAPIAEIVLNRPAQRNALDDAVFDGLMAAIARTANDESVRVVLLRGEGPVFCAGNDLKERAGMSLEQLADRRSKGRAVFDALEHHPRPCIAVVHGPAVAAGIELALCCDFIIAGEAATFRYPEGIRGAGGGTRRLPHIVGKAMAKQILFTGMLIDAQEALRLRLVNRVVPDEQLLGVAREIAATIAKGRPHATTQTKRAIDRGVDAAPDDAERLEQEAIDAAIRFQSGRDGDSRTR
jgi:enoyl-CoA hydratase